MHHLYFALKRQLLTTDLTQELGTIEVSRSLTDHLADWLPEPATIQMPN